MALVAGAESLTRITSGLLPDRVPLADAIFTGSRTALAVLAFTQRPDLLLPATEDRLHQDYRRPAYPRVGGPAGRAARAGRAGRPLGRRTDRARPDHRRLVARGLDLHRFTPLPLLVDVDTGWTA